MILDGLLRVSDAQAVTATAVSTDVIDLGVAMDIGEGEPMSMAFEVVTAFAGLTSLTFQIVGSASANLSSSVVLGSSSAIARASLTAGKRVEVGLDPQLNSTGYRYIGANYVVVGTGTAGNVTADLVVKGMPGDGNKYYASGFTVD